MGKYDEVVDRLPTWDFEERSYQDKINARKKFIFDEIGEALSSGSLALLYKNAREEKEKIEEQLYDANLELAALSQMLVDQYEIDGISSTRLSTGETISMRYEPYAVVEDKEKIWNWCKENGYEREMQLTWQTLNAIVKDRLLKGEPEPEGVRAYSRTKLTFGGGKK